MKPEMFLMSDADIVLKPHLQGITTVEELVDSVYAFGRVVMDKMNVKVRTSKSQRFKCNR